MHSNPIHAPCPDMAGMTNPDPQKRKRALFLVQKLREKHGLNKKQSLKHQRPLNYICTTSGCHDSRG